MSVHPHVRGDCLNPMNGEQLVHPTCVGLLAGMAQARTVHPTRGDSPKSVDNPFVHPTRGDYWGLHVQNRRFTTCVNYQNLAALRFTPTRGDYARYDFYHRTGSPHAWGLPDHPHSGRFGSPHGVGTTLNELGVT